MRPSVRPIQTGKRQSTHCTSAQIMQKGPDAIRKHTFWVCTQESGLPMPIIHRPPLIRCLPQKTKVIGHPRVKAVARQMASTPASRFDIIQHHLILQQPVVNNLLNRHKTPATRGICLVLCLPHRGEGATHISSMLAHTKTRLYTEGPAPNLHPWEDLLTAQGRQKSQLVGMMCASRGEGGGVSFKKECSVARATPAGETGYEASLVRLHSLDRWLESVQSKR